MQQLPKIARERLRIETPVAAHPDPDVLTAFSEQSLPERERSVVVEHLARCGDCREVVALALPLAEEVQVHAAVPGRRWLTWPGLRWAVVAAGVVMVGSFGVLRYGKHPGTAAVASRNEVAAYISAQPASTSEAKQQEKKSEKDQNPAPKPDHVLYSQRNPVTPTNSNAMNGKAAGAPQRVGSAKGSGFAAGATVGGVEGGSFRQGPKIALARPPAGFTVTSDLKSNATFPPKNLPPLSAPAPQQNAPAAPPVPSASETVEVQTQAQAGLRTEAVSSSSQSRDQVQPQVLQNQSGQQSSDKDQEVLRAKSSAAAPANLNTRGLLLERRNQPPYQWTINSSGTLQRSFDMGRTWQTVEVDESSPSFSYTDETLAKQSKLTKAEKKQRAKEATGNTQFRAVVAAGPEVWAGGTGGMLYHSVDGGEHWARIILKAAGVVVTGDIVSVEFTDPQHGRITTSTSQVWTTSDGGKSWQD